MPTSTRDSTPSPDTERFTFSDHGPWVVDRDALAWTPGLAVLRATVRRQVPTLTTRRRLPPPVRLAVVSSRLGVALGGWALAQSTRPAGSYLARNMA